MQSRIELARDILGDDFLSLEEVSQVRGITYSRDQLVEFGKTLPDEEVLLKYRRRGCILVPGPSADQNLLEIHALSPHLFEVKTSMWYTGLREKFSRREVVKFRHYAFMKEPAPRSLNKEMSSQCNLLTKSERVPNIAEAVWCITTYELVRSIKLYQNVWAWSSTEVGSSLGQLVTFGRDFPKEGLRIDSWHGNIAKVNVGISAISP